MKKTAQKILMIVLSVVICFCSTPIFATASTGDETSVTPRWSHLHNAAFTFSATDSGGHTVVTYEGYRDSFSKAEVTIKVQKRFLLVFWTDVGEWSSSSTSDYGEFYHVFDLNGSGTYKATFTLTITGTDGTIDTLTDSRESSC